MDEGKAMKEEFEVVMGEINQLIVENDFPLSVVQDVYFRLIGCQEPHYARQQLRFLKNVKRDLLDGEASRCAKER